jgi:hypothetical protein
MRANVDQEQNLRAGFRMFLFHKNNPAVVTGGTRVESGQLSAQVMRLQSGVVEVFRQAPQGRLDLRLQRGIFSDQTTERPIKSRSEDKFAHGSFTVAQMGNDTSGRLALEFAGTKGFDSAFGFRRRCLPPSFNAALAQQAFEHFLFVNSQRLGLGQD